MISYFVWFDLYDPGNREDLEYSKFEFTSRYFKSYNQQWTLYYSGYCGALFLGVL